MQPNLTPAQEQAVRFGGSQQVIYGVPGSGKTTVLLRRAQFLAEQAPSTGITVRMFTFNKTLAKFARDQIELNRLRPGIEVVNFHKWAWKAMHSLVPGDRLINVFDDKGEADVIRRVIAAYQPRSRAATQLLDRDIEWWAEEFAWLKGALVDSLEQYLVASRVGRGSALSAPLRSIAWEVFEQYQRELERQHAITFHDYAPLLIRFGGIRLPQQWGVDHVLIDEAQDLDYAQLRVLTQLPRRSVTIAADRQQKIYKKTFSWKDLGLDVTGGRTKTLNTSFRSTRQIIDLAASLRRHDQLVRPDDDDFIVFDTPARDGPIPIIYEAINQSTEDSLTVDVIRHLQRDHYCPTIAILARSWQRLYRLSATLQRRGISFEQIKEHDGSATTTGIKLTSFHSAKGLEFHCVILIGLDEGLFPPRMDRIGDPTDPEDLKEMLGLERRLLYVSMTRAQHSLHLVHGSMPSRFLAELDPTCYVRSNSVSGLTPDEVPF